MIAYLILTIFICLLIIVSLILFLWFVFREYNKSSDSSGAAAKEKVIKEFVNKAVDESDKLNVKNLDKYGAPYSTLDTINKDVNTTKNPNLAPTSAPTSAPTGIILNTPVNEEYKKNSQIVLIDYHSQNNDVNHTMTAIQTLINTLKTETCVFIMENVDLKSMKTELKNNIGSIEITCIDMKNGIRTEFRKTLEEDMTKEQIESFKKTIDSLIYLIEILLDISCSDGTLDIEKFFTLVQDMQTVVCQK